MSRSAGAFGAWLTAMRAVLRGEQAADVPCGECTGCCVSSYPIPLRPGDRVALERVPDQYLVLPVSGGTARMGFRRDGSCPMLAEGRCSIYLDRPQTCRDYDCRIYAAAGLVPDGRRPAIEQRVREWRFDYEDEAARASATGVRQAAAFIRRNARLFPTDLRSHSATAVAVLAVKVGDLFIREAADTAPEALIDAIVGTARDYEP